MHGAVLLLFQYLHMPWKNTYHLIQFVRNSELRVVGLNVSTFYESYLYLNQAVNCNSIGTYEYSRKS